MKLPAKIRKSTKTCFECGKAFKRGDSYVSSIIEEEGEWFRKDYCPKCNEEDERILASWTREVPNAKGKMVLSEDAVWQVLRKAQNDEELAQRPATYFLCLLFVRKRRVRLLRTTRRGGREYQIYSNKSQKFEIQVPFPLLTPSAFKGLKEEIQGYFSDENG